MDRFDWKWRVAAIVAASTLGVSAAARAGDWLMYRYDERGSSDPGEPLSLDAARGFQGNWTASTKGWNYANPIVAGDTIYLTSGDGNLYAFDARNGALLWSRFSGVQGPFHCIASTSKGPIGAPAVVGSTVFMPGADGIVYAYDSTRNGALLWKTQIADVRDLGEFLWTSAFALKGKVYFGISSLHDCLLVPGRMVALDQKTGALTGTWWADEKHGSGGGVWTQPAYDARTNRFFMTTGTIAPGLLPAQQPNADAFVAIDPDAMKTVDSFSPVAGLFGDDLDFGASPTLFDTPDGRHLIAAANKNGVVYALDRDNLAAGVVWSYVISASGASPDMGESTIVSAPYANGMLFVAGGRTLDGHPGAVAALDGATGQQKWIMFPDGFVLAAMTTAGDTLVFGTGDVATFSGNLYVVAQQTGEVLYKLQAGVFFGQPTFANGQLFAGDLNGALFALLPGGSSIVPDFVFSLSPSSQELGAGQSVTYKVSTNSAQPVALTVSGLSPQVTAAFSSPSVTAGRPATLTLSVPAGTASSPSASFTVRGRSPANAHSASASVRIAASDFSLTVPTTVGVPPGLTRTVAVATAPTRGVPETVALSVTGLPAGLTGQLSPTSVLAGQPATLTLTASAAAAAGSVPIDVAAVAASATHHAPVRIVVASLPTTAVTAPVAGTVVSGRVPISVVGTAGAGTTLVSVSVFADGNAVGSSQTSPATIPWDASAIVSGDHLLTAVVEDAAGNRVTSEPVAVVVDDGIAPQVSVQASGGQTTVTGTVDLRASATPSGAKAITHLDILVDGNVVHSGSGTDLRGAWDSRSVSNGAHSLSATATDSAGRSAASQTLTLNVSNAKSSGCGSVPGGSAGELIGVLAFAILRLVRRRPPART